MTVFPPLEGPDAVLASPRAGSSAVERRLYTANVAGSIPVPPTDFPPDSQAVSEPGREQKAPALPKRGKYVPPAVLAVLEARDLDSAQKLALAALSLSGAQA